MTEKRENILVVDDEELVRKLLCQKLSGEGYQCHQAGSAEQALDKLEETPAKLVLLDVKMPGKSGYELLLEILASYPDTAVIMATAITDTNLAIECMKQGAHDYLNKPFNLDEVVISVDRALEKRRLKLENRDYQQNLEKKVDEQSGEIRNSYLNAITALAHALEAKDKYTSGHSQRVAEIAVAIAEELDVPSESIEKIRLAGLVHDIGKIGIRESVLNKPSTLTEKEYQQVQSHCEIGERILGPVIKDRDILDMVRHHHEWYNGSGYPDSLAGERMLLGTKILALSDAYDTMTSQLVSGARILAVSDAYDAMTSERPYREAMSDKEACEEIESGKGTQFDPEVVDAFFRMREKKLESLDVMTPRIRE